MGGARPGESAIVENRNQQGYRVQAGMDAFVPPRLILVGEVSSFRKFDDATSSKYYDSYVEFAHDVHPDAGATVTLEQFKEQFEGWTRLRYSQHYRDALVPFELGGDVRFPSPAGVFWGQATGDLVAARSNADGFYIVERVLCRDDAEYSACADQYVKGVFDSSTGFELDGKLRPKNAGKTIDINSYKFVR